MAISAERLLELSGAFDEAFNARDWSAVRKMYAENAVYVSPNPPLMSREYGNRIEGADAIVELCERFPLADDARFEVLEKFAGVDLVATVWRLGDLAGVDMTQFGPDELIIQQYDVTAKPSTLRC